MPNTNDLKKPDFRNPADEFKNPFRNPFSGEGTPFFDTKHVSFEQIKKMTPEEISNLDTSKLGSYQLKYTEDAWGLDQNQQKALQKKILEKIKEKLPYLPRGGKTQKRKRRKGRKSRKHRKSRRSRK